MKKLFSILVFLLLAGALCGCAKEEEEKEINIRAYDESQYKGQEFKLENDRLLFEFDPATTHFTVTDKKTGQTWLSNPVDAKNDPYAGVAGRKQLEATLVLEYKNVNDMKTILDNYTNSISTGIYDIEKVGDQINVHYTIGKVAKTYYIPPAVPDARMHEFFDKMELSQQRKVQDWYRKYDWNNLLGLDDPAELKTMYPDIEETFVWVVREATKDHQKEKLEEYFAAAGYTKEDYEADCLLYESSNTNKKPLYNVTLSYRLDGDKLVVEVPMEEIEYKNKYPITSLSVLPYFGAGTTEETGFVLVPEGSGAIIDFNNGKTTQAAYYAQLYGWDWGLKRDVIVDETRANFPVFGISKGESSFISIIDDYSSIATIRAGVAGKDNNYNYVYSSYEMIHTSVMEISGRSDNTIVSFEKELPKGTLKQSYCFIDSGDYVDMAERYREDILEKNPELQKVTDADLPVSVELLGAIDRIKQVAGIPVSRPDVLTSFADAKKILEDIVNRAYAKNLSVRYSGWMNGGLNHSIPKDIDLTSGLGGKKKLDAFIDYAQANNVDVYLSGRVQNAYDSNIFDGFLRSRDTAKYISRELSDIPQYSYIYFSGKTADIVKPHYLLRPTVCVKMMNSMAEYAKKLSVGVGYEDVGYLLSGDYNQKREVDRETSMNMQIEQLAAIKKAGTPIILTYGNDYVLPYASLVTDMELEGKQYVLFDRQVPFLQIAVHGYVSYTGDALNVTGNLQDLLLKSAEAGAGLSFAYMASNIEQLQDTEHMDFFGCYYDGWKEFADEYCTRYLKEMAGLNNQLIVDHKTLAENVTATTYENGTVVYVNSGMNEYTDGALSIPAKDYKVERSGN